MTTATDTAVLAGRVPILLAAIRKEGGEWTTERARVTYALLGRDVPCRRTCRRDLDLLARRGLIARHGPDNNRHYTLNPKGQAA
jgi:predicted transcriptional regulator